MYTISLNPLATDFEIVYGGDEQEGNRALYQQGLDEMIDHVMSTKNCFMIHMGDEQDAFWIDDPRYDIATTITCPMRQQQVVIDRYLPMAKAGKLLGIHFGNHTKKLLNTVGNITEMTCERLSKESGIYVPYLGLMVTIEVADKYGLMFKSFSTHGKKQVGSVAEPKTRRNLNMKIQLMRHLREKTGDCIIMAKGHTHKLLAIEPEPELYITVGKDGIKQHYTTREDFGTYIPPEHRWYFNTGSFLKTFGEGFDTYCEFAEYDPVELGYCKATIRDRKVVKGEAIRV